MKAAASASAASVRQCQQLRQAIEAQGRDLERLAWLLASAGVQGERIKSLQDAAALAAALSSSATEARSTAQSSCEKAAP
eukprot:14479-Heterococcus_DN1.PRE.1